MRIVSERRRGLARKVALGLGLDNKRVFLLFGPASGSRPSAFAVVNLQLVTHASQGRRALAPADSEPSVPGRVSATTRATKTEVAWGVWAELSAVMSAALLRRGLELLGAPEGEEGRPEDL